MPEKQTSEKRRPLSPYFLGAQFLKFCVKNGWLEQEGTGGRGTRWYATEKGKRALREKFDIEV